LATHQFRIFEDHMTQLKKLWLPECPIWPIDSTRPIGLLPFRNVQRFFQRKYSQRSQSALSLIRDFSIGSIKKPCEMYSETG
jgi:hypothetical protein